MRWSKYLPRIVSGSYKDFRHPYSPELLPYLICFGIVSNGKIHLDNCWYEDSGKLSKWNLPYGMVEVCINFYENDYHVAPSLDEMPLSSFFRRLLCMS
jgi:hypothetical protein